MSDALRTLRSFGPLVAATVTFADRGENEYGLQIEGSKTDRVTTMADLRALKAEFGDAAELHDLEYSRPEYTAQEAGLLILRGFAREQATELEHELLCMQADGLLDTTTKSYGRVTRKHARYNNVMAWRRQQADIANGRGTIVSFEDWPAFRALHDRLHIVLKQKKEQRLVGETNFYFDVTTCGIGFHGDKERTLVAGVCLGEATGKQTLKFVDYYGGKPLGPPQEFKLRRGDVYIMSHKAMGADGGRSNIVTWRHARGAPTCKYSRVNPKHAKRPLKAPPSEGAAAAKKPRTAVA